MKSFYIIFIVFFGIKAGAQINRDSFLSFLEDIQHNKGFLELKFKNFADDADWMYDEVVICMEKNKHEFIIYYYSVAWILAERSSSKDLKKKVIHLFLDGANSREFNISNYCIQALNKFKKEEFHRAEIQKIQQLLQNPNTQTFDLFLLCGYLDIQQEKKYLKQNIVGHYKPRPFDHNSYYKSNEWAAYLALARMGDRTSLEYILQRYRAEKDLFDKCKIISKHLDYVKKEETHKELISIFIGDLEIPPDYPETEGTPCGQNFIYFLAKSIKNYPYPIKRAYYPEDIEKARAWFATRPKIIINRDIF